MQGISSRYGGTYAGVNRRRYRRLPNLIEEADARANDIWRRPHPSIERAISNGGI